MVERAGTPASVAIDKPRIRRRRRRLFCWRCAFACGANTAFSTVRTVAGKAAVAKNWLRDMAFSFPLVKSRRFHDAVPSISDRTAESGSRSPHRSKKFVGEAGGRRSVMGGGANDPELFRVPIGYIHIACRIHGDAR